MPAFTLTQKIASNLILTIVIAIALIGSVLVWLATEADRQAADATQRMIRGGLEQNLEALKRHVNDYAFWEDAWAATNENNQEWLNGNVGSGVLESKTVTAIAIVGVDGSIKYKWQGEIATGGVLDYFMPNVIGQVQESLKGGVARPEEAKAFYWRIENSVFAFSAQRLSPGSETTIAASASRDYVVFANELSSSDALSLGSPFLINDLAIKPANIQNQRADGRISFNLTNPQNLVIAELNWTPPQPGTNLLKAVAAPVAFALFVMLLSGSWTTWRAHTLAKQLQQEKQAAMIVSQTDIQTGLPNRVGFNDFIDNVNVRELALEGAFVLWQIDLNNFKSINDSLGHKFGDELINLVSEVLRTATPANAYIARTGSNEFLVVGLGLELVRNAAAVASRFVSKLSGGLVVNNHNVDISVAVCYAFATSKAPLPEDVVLRAGLAMHEAKSTRLVGIMPYNQALESALIENQSIEAILRRAISENGFRVHYQPIFNAHSGKMDHAEALVRLTPELSSNIGPDKFIAVAEKTGLIQEIGLIVLKQVVRDAASFPGLKIGVNVSPVQLLNSNFVETAADVVNKAGLQPSQIAFELTEGVLIHSPELARRQLQALKQHGFDLYLDDFGSGFSSIGYLKQFPFDALKIDRSVVQAAFETRQGQASLVAISSLANAMNISVFAEGVENQTHFDLLTNLGCRWLQGWHIGKAVAANELKATIEAFILSHRSTNFLRSKAAEMRVKLPEDYELQLGGTDQTKLVG